MIPRPNCPKLASAFDVLTALLFQNAPRPDGRPPPDTGPNGKSTSRAPAGLFPVAVAHAAEADIAKLTPHDLRRTCARLCHLTGGELDQIQFLLGHVSIQTTERYLGCKQKLRHAVNDRMGIEPDAT